MESPKLVFAPRTDPPFPVDALVEEEDSYLSLSAEPVLEMPGEHPIRVMTAARESGEVEPGTVVVRRDTPLRLLAVVHRLHENPTWRESWIEDAVDNLRAEVERRQLRAIGTPILGTGHGKIERGRALELLRPLWTAPLDRVWIITR